MSGVLDVFTLPSTDVSIQGYRISAYDQKGSGIVPMEFKIDGMEEFVDLSRSYIKLEFALDTPAATNKGIFADSQATGAANNESDAGHTKYVYPVNNFGHSIIRQMNLRFNGTLLSLQTDMYAYKAYIETLLNYNRSEGETLLAPQGWKNYVNVVPSLASQGAADDRHTTAGWTTGTNTALKELGGLFKEKSIVTVMIRPHLEAFHTGRVLVPFVELKLEMYFNSPEFFMFGTTSNIKKPVVLSSDNIKGSFHICPLTLNPNVYAELALRRSKHERVAAYPTVRSELRSLSFEGNSTKFIEDNVFLGRVPDRLIVGLLDTKAFNGTLNYYPFAFQKFGVTSIKQIVRGEEYPYETLELNQNDQLKDWHGYFRFLQATGPMVNSGDCMVKPDKWGHAANCTLFAWNNVPSGNADSKNMNPKQAGNVKLEIKFGANPGKHLTVLVWAELENIITIDPNGAVQYNIHDI